MKKEKYITERKTKKGLTLWICIPYTDETGKKKSYSETVHAYEFSSNRIAMRCAIRIRDEALEMIRSGKMAKSYPTVNELYVRKFELFPKAYRTKEYHHTLFKSVLTTFGDTPINKIKAPDIQESLNALIFSKSDDFISRVFSIWKELYKTATLDGFVLSDLTELVTIPQSKKLKKQREVVTDTESFSRFLDALLDCGSINGVPQRINMLTWYMLKIMFYTGMRNAEVLALTRSDITDDHILINKSIGKTTSSDVVVIPTKTPSSIRSLPISDDLRPILDSLLKFVDTEQLFLNDDGTLIDTRELAQLIKKVSKLSGIPFNAYMLRHMMATYLEKNVDPRTSQDILGHSSFKTTVYYARSTEQDRLDVLNQRKLDPKKMN